MAQKIVVSSPEAPADHGAAIPETNARELISLLLMQLRTLIQLPDFPDFQSKFDEAASLAVTPSSKRKLRGICSDALEAFLTSSPNPDRDTFGWFAQHHEEGLLEINPRSAVLLRRLEKQLANKPERRLPQGIGDQTVVFQLQRIVQMSWFGTAGFRASDAIEVRQSIFRSNQEKQFAQALALRLPGLQVLPNYPLDQVVNLDRLKAMVTPDALRYGKLCRLDALLVVPREGDPVAAFELDSRYHDQPHVKARDNMKNELLHAARIPLFRLRSEDPESTSVDEWFGLLTDEIVEKINVGTRIKIRDIHASLVPLHR